MSSTRTCSRAAPPSPSRRRERSSLFFAGPVGDIPRAEDASFSKVFITSTGDAVARPMQEAASAPVEDYIVFVVDPASCAPDGTITVA